MKKEDYDLLWDLLPGYGFCLSGIAAEFLMVPEQFLDYKLQEAKYRRMSRERAKAEILEKYKVQLQKDIKNAVKELEAETKMCEEAMEEIFSQWEEVLEQEK